MTVPLPEQKRSSSIMVAAADAVDDMSIDDIELWLVWLPWSCDILSDWVLV